MYHPECSKTDAKQCTGKASRALETAVKSLVHAAWPFHTRDPHDRRLACDCSEEDVVKRAGCATAAARTAGYASRQGASIVQRQRAVLQGRPDGLGAAL